MLPLQTFTAPTAGNYLFIVGGGQGGSATPAAFPGGLGATVEATVFLQAGAVVPVIVAAQGGAAQGSGGSGGGGLSAVYTAGAGNLPTIVAGLALSLLLEARRICQKPKWILELLRDVLFDNVSTIATNYLTETSCLSISVHS